MKRNPILAGTAAVLFLFNSCATNPVTGKKDVILVSEGQELSMGQQADPEITAQFGLYPNETLQKFINEKGQQMVAVSHRSNIKYTFKVLDSPQMADFFLTLQRNRESSGAEAIPDFMSTHPNPGDRYVTVGKLAQDWKAKQNLTNPKVNRDSYLRMIDGIVYGEDPKQGFVENQVFYHPELKFQFPIPAGWQFQNSPQQFQMAPKDGKALMTLSLAAGTSPEAAAQDMVQKNKLTVVESKKVTVNGLPALAVIADQAPQQEGQAAIRTMTYFIQYGNAIYRLMGVSLATDFNTYANAFQATMRNFKTLTDANKLNRQPERVRIKTIAQSTTLGQALKGFGITDKRLEEMAILNGMALNDQVTKGMLIKVVRQ